MPRLPRDLSGSELIKKLGQLGYQVERQVGSHVRLGREIDGQQHRLTVPLHDSVRIGTLNQILRDLAARLGLSKSELTQRLFG